MFSKYRQDCLAGQPSILLHKTQADLFNDLDSYLLTSGLELSQVFAQADLDHDRYLNLSELSGLLTTILKNPGPADIAFFQAMIDADDRGSVNFEVGRLICVCFS